MFERIKIEKYVKALFQFSNTRLRYSLNEMNEFAIYRWCKFDKTLSCEYC